METEEIFSKDFMAIPDECSDLHKLVLDNSHVGIIVCDAEGIIRYMNKMYAETYDLDRFKAIGNRITIKIVSGVERSGIPDTIG